MSDPAFAETYPQFMMLEAEREAEEVRVANDYNLPIQLDDELRASMREVYARSEREKAAASMASDRYHLTTGKGRVAAERVDAAARTQMDATRERNA